MVVAFVIIATIAIFVITKSMIKNGERSTEGECGASMTPQKNSHSVVSEQADVASTVGKVAAGAAVGYAVGSALHHCDDEDDWYNYITPNSLYNHYESDDNTDDDDCCCHNNDYDDDDYGCRDSDYDDDCDSSSDGGWFDSSDDDWD